MMTALGKVLLLEMWFFLGFPILGSLLTWFGGAVGGFVAELLFTIWCWDLFAFAHYRFCRQEEFLHVLTTAAATEAPLEAVLRAYVEDRPREHLYRSILLFFVFPGYYWFHLQRSFDYRLNKLVDMLESGVPLDRALCFVPGVASREIALAVNVGQYTGNLGHALHRLPDPRLASRWLQLLTRLAYPLLVLSFLLGTLAFVIVFIIPKFEKIFSEFRLKLPWITELLVSSSRFSEKHAAFGIPALWLLVLILFNVLVFSSRAKWYCPVINWVYRPHARGQFLQTLGLMLESGRPLPALLDHVLDSELLPTAIAMRVVGLSVDLRQGQPLSESLV